jgi:hypothetical protein
MSDRESVAPVPPQASPEQRQKTHEPTPSPAPERTPSRRATSSMPPPERVPSPRIPTKPAPLTIPDKMDLDIKKNITTSGTDGAGSLELKKEAIEDVLSMSPIQESTSPSTTIESRDFAPSVDPNAKQPTVEPEEATPKAPPAPPKQKMSLAAWKAARKRDTMNAPDSALSPTIGLNGLPPVSPMVQTPALPTASNIAAEPPTPVTATSVTAPAPPSEKEVTPTPEHARSSEPPAKEETPAPTRSNLSASPAPTNLTRASASSLAPSPAPESHRPHPIKVENKMEASPELGSPKPKPSGNGLRGRIGSFDHPRASPSRFGGPPSATADSGTPTTPSLLERMGTHRSPNCDPYGLPSPSFRADEGSSLRPSPHRTPTPALNKDGAEDGEIVHSPPPPRLPRPYAAHPPTAPRSLAGTTKVPPSEPRALRHANSNSNANNQNQRPSVSLASRIGPPGDDNRGRSQDGSDRGQWPSPGIGRGAGGNRHNHYHNNRIQR